MERYSQLLSLHPASVEYNYRYGACLVYADADKEKAFKHLRFAIAKEGAPNEAYYFLGKAYHLNYQFADAIESYEKYKELTGGKRNAAYHVDLALNQCQNGLNLLSNIKDVKVLHKVETSAEDFFRNYDLDDIGGRILVCPEELLTKYDLKSGERFLMYFPGNTSIAFYSSYGKNGETGRDIYRAARLPNGNWSKPIPMTQINTPYNDDFPFLNADGKTFYFASEGHSSMGGYDIFKCEYNASDDSFTQPQNLDFAVNSADDDLLYITDKQHKLAYFASARSSNYDRMHVYKVLVSSNPLKMTFLQGVFYPEAPGVTRSARISVVDASTNQEIGVYTTDKKTGEYVIDLPRSGRYKFTVDADGSKHAHTGMVEVPAADKTVAYHQELKLVVASNNEKLIIKNEFDRPITEGLYDLAQGVLRYRAGLDVNADGSEQPVEAAAPVVEGEVESAYTAAGFSASMSNQAVLDAARQEESTLAEKSETMEQQRDYAFTIAQKKKEVAEKAAKDAKDHMRMADAVGNEEKSSQYLMQAMASKYAAEKNTREAKVALQLAEQLDERIALLDEAKTHAAVMAEGVETSLGMGDYAKIVEKLTEYKEYQVAQSENPVHQQDEYLLLRTQAREKQQANTLQSDRAQELREEENSLTLRVKNRKLHLESAKNKDKPAIEQEIQLLEEDLAGVVADADRIFAELNTAQSEAGELSQQAELFQRIQQKQTEVYVSESDVIAFDPAEVGTMQTGLSQVNSDTKALEPNLQVVERILVEEGNVALEAFGNKADYEEFIAQYNLPAKPRESEQAASQQVKDEATLQSDIEAANNWMGVIDDSMRELEAERAQLPAGSQRDEVDKQLAEFQELKFKKVKEVDSAKEQLSALDETAMAPYTIASDETSAATSPSQSNPEIDEKQEASSESRKTQTIAQQSPVYELVDPEYQAAVETLTNADLSQSEALRQKNTLDRSFIEKIDQKLAEVTDGDSPKKQQLIQELNTLRNTVSDDLILNESLLAESNSEEPQKTSTEILLEESGLADEEEQAATQTQPERIPESISYADIDPEYTEKLSRLENNADIDSDAEKLTRENELHQNFVSDIDSQINRYQTQLRDAEPTVQARIDRAIGQLQQVKAIKEQEISDNESQKEVILEQQFYTENELITQQVDTGYVNQFLAIEKSENAPYFKTVEKAKLEREIVEKMADRVAELTEELDDALNIDRKDEIQETIQDLEDLRQEKTIAYESLFAQAEALQQEDEMLTETAEESVEGREEAQPEEDEYTGFAETEQVQTSASQEVDEADEIDFDELGESNAAADTRASETESTTPDLAEMPTTEDEAVSDSGQEEIDSEVVAVETQIAEFIDDNEAVRQNLNQYTVFSEVDNMVYKSLNASLDMEALGGDLRRHQQQISSFAAADETGELNETERAALTEYLQKELVLQEKIAEANRREMEFYEVGNEQLFESIERRTSQKVNADDLMAAKRTEQRADSLRTSAQSLREKATTTTAFDERMVLQKAAFEEEVASIQAFSQVNATLEQWNKGEMISWPGADEDVILVAQRAAPAEPKTEPIAQQTETPSMAESVEESSETQASEVTKSPVLSAGAIDHFELSTTETERIAAEPALLGWFGEQWKADSLEVIKTQRFTQAENLLNQAEQQLQTAEELNEEAAIETDAAKQREYNNRAAELQDEARALFEEARRLREEMSGYEKAANDARAQANTLLAGMSQEERTTAEELMPRTAISDRSTESSATDNSPVDVSASRSETESQTNEANENTARSTEATRTPETAPIEAPEVVERVAEANRETVDTTQETTAAADVPEPRESTTQTAGDTDTQSPRTAESPVAPIDFSAGINRPIEFINEPAYSASNPIPVNSGWPDGLVFAVQIGAFRNPIPQDHFRGFTPIRGEQISTGITRYSAGLFDAFNQARTAQNAIRDLGYSDAFVVAYLNGERIALNRALNEAEAAEIIAASEVGRSNREIAQNAAARAPDRSTEASTQTTTEARSEIITEARRESEVATSATSPQTSRANAQTGLATDYYNDPDAAQAVQVERITGLFFTVQVGVYSNPVTGASLNNISPLNSEQTANGYIRYTSGMFPSVDFAQDHRQIVVNAGVADAFVTAYHNGRRITVSEARSLLEREGAGVLAGSREAVAPSTDTQENAVAEEEPVQTEAPVEQPDNTVAPSDYADVADFNPADIRFVLDLGSFGTGMPQQTADAILQTPEAGVSRFALTSGRMHYLSRPTTSYAEVEALKEKFEEKGAENLQVRAMALGFLLDLESAREATGQ